MKRIALFIDWVRSLFDAKKYPWFRDEFIHPNDLAKAYGGEPLVNMFAGFAETASDSKTGTYP